ncbi:hypothetical protein F5Y15DRAFT_123767 [Xylariaceae sp. FL0016]|nr:hypothetical protein F5Y15DRAFT_123767 [Xylariaceae sp. FL0016]
MATDSTRTKDIRPIQRLITTHTKDGRTAISDVLPEAAPFKSMPDGADFALCYATDNFPVQTEGDADLKAYKGYTENLPGVAIATGTVLRVVDMEPGHTSPLHRTISVDYGVVLEGEIELILDSGEKRALGRGDIVVQRGTNHAWKNIGTGWARMLYVLQPAESITIGGKVLEDNSKEALSKPAEAH